MVDRPRVAVDKDGVLHVLWVEYSFPETHPPLGLRYSQSSDGGANWSWPLQIDGPFDYPELVVLGDNEIHIAWSGTHPDRVKYHTWSEDGGLTWRSPDVTVDVGGYQGSADLVEDSAGGLHLVQVAGPPEVLYHQQWAVGRWSRPEPLLAREPGAPIHPRDAAASVTRGNQLTVLVSAMTQQTGKPGEWSFDIMYLGSEVASPAVAPRARDAQPQVQATPSVLAAADLASDPVSLPTHVPATWSQRELPVREQRALDAVWVGIAPAALVVLLAGAARLRRGGR